MTVTINGRAIEVKRVSETMMGNVHRFSFYCEEKNLDALMADLVAHGPGNPIVVNREDGTDMTYENGYTRIDGLERTIATGEGDITIVNLNLVERPVPENIVIEPAPVPEEDETPADEAAE